MDGGLMDIVKPATLDILEKTYPALSATSDMPVIETKPDATPAKEAEAVPPEPEAEDGEAEPSGESATPATETPGQPAPRGVGKKIAELTKQREEANRRADSERDERLRLLAIIEAGKTKEADEPVKPVKADFPDPDAWDEALMLYAEQKATYTARREVAATLAEESEKSHKAAVAEGQRIAREAYQQRMEKAKDKYADFDEVAGSPDVKVSMPVAHAIIQSENGTDIQYYLGKHPEEAERISQMTVTQFNPQTRTMDTVPDVARQLLELGLIVGKITAPKPPISSAPKPLKPLKGGDVAPPLDLQSASMDQYVKARRQH